MRASTADPVLGMKVAKMMHFDDQLVRVTKDVEKLMNISAQHGMKIKELILAAANSVSQVEFMSAITTTRFQNLNVAKTMKSNKEGEPNPEAALKAATSSASSAMHEELKAQISQIENEMFNQNFKSGIDMKKLENEVKIRQKEIYELKNHIKSLEQKLEKFAEAVEAGGIQTNIKFAPPSESKPSKRKQSTLIFSDDLEDEINSAGRQSNDSLLDQGEKDHSVTSGTETQAQSSHEEKATRVNTPPLPHSTLSEAKDLIESNQPDLSKGDQPGINLSSSQASNLSLPAQPTSAPSSANGTADLVRRMSLARQQSPIPNPRSSFAIRSSGSAQDTAGIPIRASVFMNNLHSNFNGNMQGDHYPAGEEPNMANSSAFIHQNLQSTAFSSGVSTPHLMMPVPHPSALQMMDAQNMMTNDELDVELICKFVFQQISAIKMVEEVSKDLAEDAINNIINKLEPKQEKKSKILVERVIQTEDSYVDSYVDSGPYISRDRAPSIANRRRSSVIKLVDSKRSSFFSASFLNHFKSDTPDAITNALRTINNDALTSGDRMESVDRRVSRRSSIRKSVLHNESIEVIYSLDEQVNRMTKSPPLLPLVPEALQNPKSVNIDSNIDDNNKSLEKRRSDVNTINRGTAKELEPLDQNQLVRKESHRASTSSLTKNTNSARISQVNRKVSASQSIDRSRMSSAVDSKSQHDEHGNRNNSMCITTATNANPISHISTTLDYVSDQSLDILSNQPSEVVVPILANLHHNTNLYTKRLNSVSVPRTSIPMLNNDSNKFENKSVVLKEEAQHHAAHQNKNNENSTRSSQRNNSHYNSHMEENPIPHSKETLPSSDSSENLAELIHIEPLTLDDIYGDDDEHNVFSHEEPLDPEEAIKMMINEVIDSKLDSLCNHLNLRFQVMADAVNQHMYHHIDALYKKITASQEYIHKYSYPNIKELIRQYNDLVDRVNELETWDEALLGPLQLSVEKYREEIDEMKQSMDDFFAAHDVDTLEARSNERDKLNRSPIVLDVHDVEKRMRHERESIEADMNPPPLRSAFAISNQNNSDANAFEMEQMMKQLRYYGMLCEDIYGHHVQITQRLNKIEGKFNIHPSRYVTESPNRQGRGMNSTLHSPLPYAAAAPTSPSTWAKTARPATLGTPYRGSNRIMFTDDISAFASPVQTRGSEAVIKVEEELKEIKADMEIFKKALQQQFNNNMMRRASSKSLRSGRDFTTISQESLLLQEPSAASNIGSSDNAAHRPMLGPSGSIMRKTLDNSSAINVQPMPPNRPKSSNGQQSQQNPLLSSSRKHVINLTAALPATAGNNYQMPEISLGKASAEDYGIINAAKQAHYKFTPMPTAIEPSNEVMSVEKQERRSVWQNMGSNELQLEGSVYSDNSMSSSDFYHMLHAHHKTKSSSQQHQSYNVQGSKDSELWREVLAEEQLISEQSIREMTK